MTCKECVYAIPDNDMQAYECEFDHGLRYGYDGCDAEELKAKVTEALPALCDNDLAACVQEDSADEQ